MNRLATAKRAQILGIAGSTIIRRARSSATAPGLQPAPVRGPAALSVPDARGKDAGAAVVPFGVTPSRAVAAQVKADYAKRNGNATLRQADGVLFDGPPAA